MDKDEIYDFTVNGDVVGIVVGELNGEVLGDSNVQVLRHKP